MIIEILEILNLNECFPIDITVADPIIRQNCMQFARSVHSPGLECELRGREQV